MSESSVWFKRRYSEIVRGATIMPLWGGVEGLFLYLNFEAWIPSYIMSWM
jgi:hypothetical protein